MQVGSEQSAVLGLAEQSPDRELVQLGRVALLAQAVGVVVGALLAVAAGGAQRRAVDEVAGLGLPAVRIVEVSRLGPARRRRAAVGGGGPCAPEG